MDWPFVRKYLVELVGMFAVVFFSAGVVCVNQLATPGGQLPATATLTAYQPGLVGIAVAHGLIFAAMLAITVRISGGYLNPAIALMLWVFNRLDTRKFAWFVGAQFLGAFLAGMCIHSIFGLELTRLSTPHLSPEAYDAHVRLARDNLLAGTGVELLLTFFLVLAILSVAEGAHRPGLAGCVGGTVLAACVLVGFPLTGAATNPARWFGSMIWELIRTPSSEGGPAYADLFVYIAGPIVGALLAGIFYFKIYAPALTDTDVGASPAGRNT